MGKSNDKCRRPHNDMMCDIIRDGIPAYTDNKHLTKASTKVVVEYVFKKN